MLAPPEEKSWLHVIEEEVVELLFVELEELLVELSDEPSEEVVQYVVRCNEIFLEISKSVRALVASCNHSFSESWMVSRILSMSPMTASSISLRPSPISSMILSASASAAVSRACAAVSTADAYVSTADSALPAALSTVLSTLPAALPTSLTNESKPRRVLLAEVAFVKTMVGASKRAKLVKSIYNIIC